MYPLRERTAVQKGQQKRISDRGSGDDVVKLKKGARYP